VLKVVLDLQDQQVLQGQIQQVQQEPKVLKDQQVQLVDKGLKEQLEAQVVLVHKELKVQQVLQI
jgi:hypothetical protein